MSDVGSGEEGIPLNPAGFLRAAMAEGRSSTNALNAFREAGGDVRTSSWYRMAGEVRDSLSRAGELASLAQDALPGPEMIGEWSAGRAGTYAAQVHIHVRDADSDAMYSVPFTFTSENLFTPAEAEAAAIEAWTEGAADNEEYGPQQILGATTVNYYQMTGWQR